MDRRTFWAIVIICVTIIYMAITATIIFAPDPPHPPADWPGITQEPR